MDHPRFTDPPDSLLSVPRGDRWQVHRRLQELEVDCVCLDDGTLHVDANTPLAVIQSWSVIRQITAPRQRQITWLYQCWQYPPAL